jgi:phosphonoacetaldehyde hydrolase
METRMSHLYSRRYTGPLKAAILDWAGTTVDHGCLAPAAAFMAAFQGFGVPISVAQARAPMGMAKWTHIQTILNMPPVFQAWTEKYGKAPTDTDVDALYNRFLPLQVEVVARHSEVIPGVNEAVAAMRARGMKIGSTSGYPRPVMDVVIPAAARQGYEPDAVVCAGETPSGRPGPSMALKCVIDLDIHPVEACVKIGDTVVDVEEGLNAGMWSVAVTETGNEVGLPLAEWTALPSAGKARLASAAADKLARAGAHYVVPNLPSVLAVLDDIEARLRRGERP